MADSSLHSLSSAAGLAGVWLALQPDLPMRKGSLPGPGRSVPPPKPWAQHLHRHCLGLLAERPGGHPELDLAAAKIRNNNASHRDRESFYTEVILILEGLFIKVLLYSTHSYQISWDGGLSVYLFRWGCRGCLFGRWKWR